MSEIKELYSVIFANDIPLRFSDIVCELSNVTYDIARKYVEDAISRLKENGAVIMTAGMVDTEFYSYIKIETANGSYTYYIVLQMNNRFGINKVEG